jgi:hypothetical protein
MDIPRASCRALVAGSVLAASLAAARPSFAETPPVPVHVTANDEKLQLYERTADRVAVPVYYGKYGGLRTAAVYHNLCESTPCTAELSPGVHELAASHSSGAILEPAEPVVVRGPAEVRATYTDRSVVRGVGWGIIAASTMSGVGMLVAGSHTPGSCTGSGCGTTNLEPLSMVGGCLIFLGVIVGLAFATRPDAVSFEVSPLVLPAPAGSREGRLAAPNGLALGLSF